MRTTGWALLEGAERPRLVDAGTLAKAGTVSDAEGALLALTESGRPDVVAIDAPLTLPPCLCCPAFCRGPGSGLCELRSAQQVWDAGGHPVTERLTEVRLRDELQAGPLPTMRIGQIAARGVALARRILAGGTQLGAPGAVQVLEVYPYASLARLGRGDERLRPRAAQEADVVFAARVIDGLSSHVDISDTHVQSLSGVHVVDALVAAYTGWLAPDGLEPPPRDYNQAAGWIWLPRVIGVS